MSGRMTVKASKSRTKEVNSTSSVQWELDLLLLVFEPAPPCITSFLSIVHLAQVKDPDLLVCHYAITSAAFVTRGLSHTRLSSARMRSEVDSWSTF